MPGDESEPSRFCKNRPMEMTAHDVRSALLEEAAPLVRAILIRKSGMTLADSDARTENLDAIELQHEVMVRLWERLVEPSEAPPSIRDVKGYVASITYNAWSDHLREKYPKRASLKNRLRYFLSHQPKYAVWADAGGETVAGFTRWQVGVTPAPGARISALRTQQERLPAGSVPRKDMERFERDDWDRLLDALFTRLGGPTSLDDAVSLIATLIALKEDRVESLAGAGDDDDDASSADIEDEDGPRPERIHEMRSTLAALWLAICALKHDYRCAYLLNIPGAGKTRGDIEVFVLQGIATLTEIGGALALTPAQFDAAWRELELDPLDRADLATLHTSEEFFCLLWKYLPLADLLIGRLLGLEQQQVINRRMLALRELARALGAAGAKK